jgi:hypothetical protein
VGEGDGDAGMLYCWSRGRRRGGGAAGGSVVAGASHGRVVGRA